MREECELWDRASFCPITRNFYKNGVLDPDFYQDSVHLSPLGAEVLANAVFSHLFYLPAF